MAEVLVVLGRAFNIIQILILTVLIWKTTEYHNTLPEGNKYKGIIAFDVIMLFATAVGSVVSLLTM